MSMVDVIIIIVVDNVNSDFYDCSKLRNYCQRSVIPSVPRYLIFGPANVIRCANILEDHAQWRGKTKGLSYLVIANNARIVDGWMKILGG